MTKLDPLGPVAVLSPHLDDAVFSCGHFMKSHPSITVVTAMAGAPDVLHDGYNSTTTDKPYAPDAVSLRRDEDRAAVEFLGATPIWLDLLDSDYAQYRPPGDYVPAISAKIARALDDARPASVFAPLGLIH